MLAVDREQALAFRLAGHHLHGRTDPETAIAASGIQEYPPGWGAIALHARSTGVADPKRVVTVNAMRGAPYIVLRRDVRVFSAALVPDDDAGLDALVGKAVANEVREAGHGVRDALDRVAVAARDALQSGPLGRDDFHQALRQRLPDSLLPWCRGCESHHVRAGLWRALGPLGVTEMPEKATYALARPARGSVVTARAELVRRFLRCYGPATHTNLAAWAQTGPAHAKALFAAIESELEPVTVEGARRWMLAKDLGRLESPPAAAGVRMLGGHDPYVAQPDRAALTPEAGLRKKLFPAVGRPGVVLHRGSLAGLWRSRKKGERLAIEVDWLGEPVDLGREPQAVAKLRGCESARVAA